MSDKKISQLLSGGASQAADEYPIARSGANFKVTGANIAAAATSVGTLTSLTVSGNSYLATTSGSVGVGTSSPVRKFDVTGTPSSVGGDANGVLAAFVNNNTAYSSSPTSAISLWTRYNSAGGTFPMAVLQGGKENATNGNFAGVMDFITTFSDGTPYRRMRLDSSGNLGLGVTPTNTSNYVKMQISGTSGGIVDLLAGSTRHLTMYCAAGSSTIGTVSNTPLVFQTNDATKMTLDASGNLGVGTTPSYRLDVRQSSGNEIGFFATNAGGGALIRFSDGNTGVPARIGADGNNLVFQTNSSGTATERARITSGGAFQITGTLESTGNIGVPNGVQIGLNGLNSATRIYAFGGSGQAMSLDAASINCLYLGAFTSGSVQLPGIGTTASAANAFIDSANSNLVLRSTSSIRYKRDVETLEQEYADNVLALRPVWYRSKAERDNKDWGWYGLIAEEVAAIDPRIVHWGYADEDYEEVVIEQAVAQDGEPEVAPKTERRLKDGAELKPDGVQYERLSVLLLDVVKRQNARIEALEARLEALEA